jgi:hypothetical protein
MDKLHDAALDAIHAAQAAEQAATQCKAIATPADFVEDNSWEIRIEMPCPLNALSGGTCFMARFHCAVIEPYTSSEADTRCYAAARNGWPAVLAGYERQVRELYGEWKSLQRAKGALAADDAAWAAAQLRALVGDIADALGVPELRRLAEGVRE